MEGSVELRDVFNKLGKGEFENSSTLEYHILQALADQGKTVDDLLNELDLENILTSAIHRLVEVGIIRTQDDTNYLKGVEYRSETVETISSELEQENRDLQPGTTLREPGINQELRGEQSSTSEQRSVDTGRKKKEEPPGLSDIPDNKNLRNRLRQEAFKEQKEEESTSSEDDELDSLFDDALGESIEETVKDFADLDIKKIASTSKSGVIEPLVDLLKEFDYIAPNVAASKAAKEPDYQLMELILKNYPIDTEQIENELKEIDSLSLMLSNLKADDLIDQTNDYRYTITKKTYKALKDHVGGSDEQEVDKDRLKFVEHIDKPREQFIDACYALGYLEKGEDSPGEFKKVPEYEVLSIIRDYEPIESDKIKQLVDETLPVVVSQMLSKLHADGLIETDMDNKYSTTTKLYFYMAKDKLQNAVDEEEFEEFEQKWA